MELGQQLRPYCSMAKEKAEPSLLDEAATR
jgi:hypothetical protein